MDESDLFDLPCCCDPTHTVREGGRHINVVVLDKKAHSKYLCAHNFYFDGKRRHPRVTAVVCDSCIAAKKWPIYVYCLDDDCQRPYQVPVCELGDWTMENSVIDTLSM